MSKDGQLLDLETGKALERQKSIPSNSMGIFVEIEESETAYQARWAEKQVAFLQKLGDSKEEAIEQTRKSLIEFNEGLGLASDKVCLRGRQNNCQSRKEDEPRKHLPVIQERK
ncbi:hypothetical protein ACEQPO_14155 [Bacillus sp. SL00103]